MGGKGSKTNEAVLSEEAIEVLMANTHFNRFEVIEWFEGFIVIPIHLYNLFT